MSDSITRREAVDKIIRRLNQIPGPATQLYSEQIIGDNLWDLFKFVFREAFWPQYSTWGQFTLDGVTGKVTEDLTDLIRDHKDIDLVFPSTTSSRRLPLLPTQLNPYNMSGTSPKYVQLTGGEKPFTVWPLTATGTIVVHYRTLPDEFDGDDVIYINETVLVHGGAWWYLDHDGDNPGAARLEQSLFVEALEKEKSGLLHLPISFSGATDIPNEWFTP